MPRMTRGCLQNVSPCAVTERRYATDRRQPCAVCETYHDWVNAFRPGAARVPSAGRFDPEGLLVAGREGGRVVAVRLGALLLDHVGGAERSDPAGGVEGQA